MFYRFVDPQHGRLSRRDCFGHRCSGLRFVTHPFPPQEIDTAVVSDSKQPRLQRPALIKLIQLPVRLDQRLLDDVLAVHHRTHHAGTIAMQTWPKR